jgi:NAD-dependent SIR2 family protein deacetylase
LEIVSRWSPKTRAASRILIPSAWKENGATLVIVNREPTDLDDLADLVIHAEIGPTLDAAVNGSN